MSTRKNDTRRFHGYEGRVSALAVAAALLAATAVAVPATAYAQASATVTKDDANKIEEVTVTARFQKESLLTVPQSIDAFGEQTLATLNIQSFSDYVSKVPNLSYAYGNGNLGLSDSRTIAIRGISGFNTTSVYIDDTPVPETVDPQVLDIKRIEVLKGPQGTLYGEGSLGGNIRFITNQPSLEGPQMKFAAESGVTSHGGSPDYRVNGVDNIVLIKDKLALRVTGSATHTAGFVTRTYPTTAPSGFGKTTDQGAKDIYAGSASLLWQISPHFKATARIMGQSMHSNGFATAYAMLPKFKPVSYTLDRAADIQEVIDDNWWMGSLDLEYDAPWVTLTSSTSYFKRHLIENEDGTEGTTTVLNWWYGLPTSIGDRGFLWPTYGHNRRIDEEVRAQFPGTGWLSGVVGARYGDELGDGGYPPFNVPGLKASGWWPTDLAWWSYYPFENQDFSIFGEAYLKYSKFELTLGLRKFWLDQSSGSYADGLMDGGYFASTAHSTATGISPKIALKYQFNDDTMVYASASKGFRAGGPNAQLPSLCDPGLASLGLTRSQVADTKPDTVWNYEVGGKTRTHGIVLTGAAFQMDWTGIQQSVTIPVCYITIGTNAGAARIRGFELEAAGQLAEGLDVRLGFGYQNAEITKTGLSGQAVGSRIYQVPEMTGSAAATYSWTISSSMVGFVSADYSYTGDSLSGTVQYSKGVPVRAAYSLVNGRIGVDLDDNIELAIYAKNLLNAKPNLGDINPLSYTRIDVNGEPLPRVALMHPLQVGVQFKYGF